MITKSGTNELHGTLLWRYQSQRFNSVSNLDKLNGVKQAVFADNVYGFTAGGPVRRNKTFFFAGFQQENRHSSGNNLLQIPTADAVARLRALFPDNPRLDLYLGALGDLRGTGTPFPLTLGVDPQTGVDRGSVQFATAPYVFPSTNDGPQWLARMDHYQSEAHRLSWRFLYDSHLTLPMRNGSTAVTFPGFVGEQKFTHYNFAFTDSYTLGPSYTNEFRFSYERPDGRFGVIWPGSVRAGADFASSHYRKCCRSRTGFNRAISLWEQLLISGDADEADGPARISIRHGVPQANDYASAGGQYTGNHLVHQLRGLFRIRELS